MPSEIATIANLLKEHDLMRLFTFMQDCSLDDLQTRLASNRPRLLAHLRELGVITAQGRAVTPE